MISEKILLQYGAQLNELQKGEIIFSQSERADYFYQIKKGKVVLFTMSEDGKQFTQGLFEEGESFGEPLLFIDKDYPSTASTLTEAKIYRLFKDSFFQLIQDNPECLLAITRKMSSMIYFKAKMGSVISLNDPENRILTLLKYIKTKDVPEKIELTRQQIANLTALRVETVIRTIKAMEAEGKLVIKNRKVYY
ncbi:MAG: Crp/Fnr family transcriptional regulator [Flavobacteriaceae bacterium]|nr:Crp/Fnr family transcriptional regulator [Flavobacteriaceae bacterium]